MSRPFQKLDRNTAAGYRREHVELIESGLEAKEQERKRFFELADRLACSRDPEEQDRIKEELARLTFGE